MECQPTKHLKLDNKEASVQVKCEPVDSYNYDAVTAASTSQKQQENRPIILEQLLTVKEEPTAEASASGNIQANNSAADKSADKEAKLIHIFTPQNLNSTVTGIAILDGRLFIVCQLNPMIEVFSTKTFSYKGSVVIGELSCPLFMTACPLKRCLYIFNKGDAENEIFRLVKEASEWQHAKWSVGTDVGDLAATSRGTLLFSSFGHSTIKEFTVDGQLIHKIILKAGPRLKLYGAVELAPDSQLVVSHGKPNGCVRSVCLLGRDGQLGRFLLPGSTGSSVQHMVVGSRTGSLFAVDFGLKEVLYWYPRLANFRKIRTRKDPKYWPLRIAVDKQDTRMFLVEVAERNGELTNCRISVYDIQ